MTCIGCKGTEIRWAVASGDRLCYCISNNQPESNKNKIMSETIVINDADLKPDPDEPLLEGWITMGTCTNQSEKYKEIKDEFDNKNKIKLHPTKDNEQTLGSLERP